MEFQTLLELLTRRDFWIIMLVVVLPIALLIKHDLKHGVPVNNEAHKFISENNPLPGLFDRYTFGDGLKRFE